MQRLEVSGAVRPLWWSLGVKGLRCLDHTHTYTADRTPLNEWPANRRGRYLLNTNTNIHALKGIRTHNPSKQATADLRLRRRGHWDTVSTRYQTQITEKLLEEVSSDLRLIYF